MFFEADLTALMLWAVKLQLRESKMTVGLELGVLQPAHSVLAMLHLVPLHLPAPLYAPLAGGIWGTLDLLYLCR